MAFKLIIRSEGGDPREIDLPDAGLTLGRHASNAVKLEGADVSRFHARVEPKGERVLVTDRESYAGTFIDGALLDGAFELSHGDHFDIGDHEIFVVSTAKSFTLPKYSPPYVDEDEDDGGDDDFVEKKKPAPRGMRVISLSPPPAEPTTTASEAKDDDPKKGGDESAKPATTPSESNANAAIDANVPSSDGNIETRPPGEEDVAGARRDTPEGERENHAAPAETASPAPLPEFKITASSDELAAALARDSGRPVSRRHYRLVFVAPEPARDPIGMRRAPITFGTDPKCTVVVEGEGTQGEHATISLENGAIVLQPADGAKVLVNGVESGRRELTVADRVEIGNVAFVTASRAREHFTAPAKQAGWVSAVPIFAPPSRGGGGGSNARAWFFAVLIIATGIAGMLYLLLGTEPPRPPPESPRTLPIEVVDATVPTAGIDASAVDVFVVLTPTEIETRLAEARSDVDAFETESALARLAVFHGRGDLPPEARIRAAMIEVAAYVADNRPQDAARACASAMEIARGDVSFLADESPRVRTLCGVAESGGDAGAPRDR